MKTLGISTFYNNSVAALVVDSRIFVATQEERVERIMLHESFPQNAIKFCLINKGGCLLDEIDQIIIYEKPFLNFDRLLETHLSFAPSGFRSFIKAKFQWLKKMLAYSNYFSPVAFRYFNNHARNYLRTLYISPFLILA